MKATGEAVEMNVSLSVVTAVVALVIVVLAGIVLRSYTRESSLASMTCTGWGENRFEFG